MTLHVGTRVSAFFLVVIAALATVVPALAAAPLSGSERRLYTSVLTLFESGHRQRALALAEQGSHPLAAKIVRWLDLSRPESGHSFDELAAFIEANPDWPGLYSLHRNAERVLPARWTAEQVLVWFGQRLPITGTGALRHAAALWDSGQKDRARAAVRQYWVALDFDSSEETAFRTRFGALLTPEDDIARLDRLLWDQRTTAARRQIPRVPASHAALAEARLALASDRRGVDGLIARVPAQLRDDAGLIYERASWRQRRARLEGVVELLDTLPAEMPQSAAWWRLRNWVVWRALDRSDYPLAYRLSARHGHGEGLAFAEGEWLAGWLALRRLDRPKAAYEHFVRLHDGVSSEISKSRGAFWAGEAASELGQLDDARRWYEAAAAFPATFYGQLAAQRIGIPRAPIQTTLPALPAATADAFGQRELVRAVRLLGSLGQSRLQDILFARLRQDAESAVDYRLLIDLAKDEGRQDVALRTAKLARRDGHDLQSLLFPVLSLPIGPAPEAALVLAVVRQESEFYAGARSPAGALGLMQLLPSTARDTARSLGLPFDQARLVSDPDYNIRLGQAYLDTLLKRFDNSYILDLAAYNAGPARARSWIKLYGDPRDPAVDPIDWIERIPFSETRNYVQRILESLVVYREGQPEETARWALEIPQAGS